MNLLTAKHYDPAVAATHDVGSSVLAMTAFDTTNLRLAFTVPAHGMVRVRISCPIGGGFNMSCVLFGVLEGASVRGRKLANPQAAWNVGGSDNTALLVADFVITDLAPGAVTWDAAYGVESAQASMLLRYGGPDDAVLGTGWGGIGFEVWDPQPLPTAAPGAANGVLVAGANAATTLTSLTVSGDTELGNVSVEGTVEVTAGDNDNAVTLVGAGTGHGLYAASGTGATGNGIHAVSLATNGNGIAAAGNGTGDGILATGGGGAGGDGIAAVAGGGVDLRANITGNITGNLSGSAGSVTGAVGSVTGNVGGNVTGSVGSVVGAVGSVTGNVGGDVAGNVTGSVGSVVGNIGGDLEGDVLGAAGTISGAVTVNAIDTGAITADALAADALVAIAGAIWGYAHEAGRTAKGVLVRLDALMTGKMTGARSSIARFFRPDGTTEAIKATQNIAAGTRDAASTITGD